MMATVRPINLKYYAISQELFFGLGGLALLIYAGVKKKLPLSITLFSLAAFILPTLTGTFSSIPRYCLSAFGVILALVPLIDKRFWFAILWGVVSTTLLIINVIIFMQGYWIA